MAITTLDGVIGGMQTNKPFFKVSATSEGAGTWHSLWKVLNNAGANPPAYTAGTGYTNTNATVGALPFTNPGSGNSYLARIAATGTVVGTLILYDRIWTISGLTTAAAATLNITTPGTIARNYDNYVGTELWGEVYTAPGATAATWTVAYTDQDGNAGTGTYAHPANAETAGQMFPFTLAAGDTGVQAVSSFTTSATSGTAGNIGLTILKRIAEIPMAVVNVANSLDIVQLGMPLILNDACLAFAVQCSGTTTGIINGNYSYTQG